jgi:hypothetical protein
MSNPRSFFEQQTRSRAKITNKKQDASMMHVGNAMKDKVEKQSKKTIDCWKLCYGHVSLYFKIGNKIAEIERKSCTDRIRE